MVNVSETVWDYIHSFRNTNRDLHTPYSQCHFEWPWVTLSDWAKYSMTQSLLRSLCDSWASSKYKQPLHSTASSPTAVLTFAIVKAECSGECCHLVNYRWCIYRPTCTQTARFVWHFCPRDVDFGLIWCTRSSTCSRQIMAWPWNLVWESFRVTESGAIQ